MVTIFSVPKAFEGHFGVIQRNAVRSWTLLRPRPEIILFGKDKGTAEFAQELGVRHEPDVATNQYGTPLLNDMFRRAEHVSSFPWIWYINADILVLSNFMDAFTQLSNRLKKFLMVTQRINLDVKERIQFTPDWEQRYMQMSRERGVLWGPTGIDIFAFTRGFYQNIPDFALGRLWFDQWLIKAARQMKAPVVDASQVASVLHQNHDYNHVSGGAEWVWKGSEAEHNLALYGEKPHTYTLLDATHELLPGGGLRHTRFRRQRASVHELVRRIILEPTKDFRHRLSLRRSLAKKTAVKA